jgi:flagellar motor switch protein FliG
METSKDRGFQRAARFIMLLGKEQAPEVLKHFSEKEVEGITKEIAQIDKLNAEEAGKVLKEFGCLQKSRELATQGGVNKAREILISAFGKEKAETFITKILKRSPHPPFSFLEDLEQEQVNLLLKDESIQVVSAILPHLNPERAAAIISKLSKEQKIEVVRRIASLEKIDPEVIRMAEEALREKVRAQGEIVTWGIDGISALAEILKYSGLSAEQSILEALKEKDEKLASEIEERLFSLDIITWLSGRDLQTVLRDFSDRELALVMKAMDENLKEVIFANVSERRREIIRVEIESLGAILRSELDKACGEFIDYIRMQAEKGEITITRNQDELVE